MRPAVLAGGLAAAALLVMTGCSERPQTYDAAAKKTDAAAWTVSDTANPAFMAPGFTPSGDQAAWLKQINARTQGQNDYSPR